MIRVREIFPSIQGEGPFTGHPAIFVRLAGCNLSCPFCDTDHNSIVDCLDIPTLIQKIKQVTRAEMLIVITGGEPMMQPLKELCSALFDSGYLVQIETNGTFYQEDLPYNSPQLTIVCSPKPNSRVDKRLYGKISAWKCLVKAGNASPIPEPGTEEPPVYIQPMDEQDLAQNRRNTEYAIQLCREYGYILSVQLHKLLEIP